jgi:O-acetyl-ADP-ribose deacetylase (regulator of RNase III)
MNLNQMLDQSRATMQRLATPPPWVLLPRYRAALENLTIEIWVSQRKLPFMLRGGAIIVPTAPDLKMVFGIAKMVRDMGGDHVQREANAVAPLAPGEAFVGTGAKYRYKYTALAVIFDQVKRTSPQLITSAVGKAMRMLRDRGVNSVIFPDMTENLLTQPNWITPEQRRETAAITARLMLAGILDAGSNIQTVRIWVWDKANAEVFIDELKRFTQRERAVTA